MRMNGLLILVVAASAAAQGSNDKVQIPPDTSLIVELQKSIDVKKAKAGDLVDTRLTQDVKSGDKILQYKGARLLGHLAEVQPRSKDSDESRLTIFFDKIVTKEGQEIPVAGTIRQLARTTHCLGSVSSAPVTGAPPSGIALDPPAPVAVIGDQLCVVDPSVSRLVLRPNSDSTVIADKGHNLRVLNGTLLSLGISSPRQQ